MVYVVLISVHVLLDSILIVLVLKLNLLSHVNRLSKQVYIFEVTAVPYMIRETRLLKVLFIHVTLRWIDLRIDVEEKVKGEVFSFSIVCVELLVLEQSDAIPTIAAIIPIEGSFIGNLLGVTYEVVTWLT